MIPYSEMTFGDFDFYWGQSILFHIIEGKWQYVHPVTRCDDSGDLLNCGDETLEYLASDGYVLTFATSNGERFEVSPLTPFRSPDWITYEPQLGYFIFGSALVLLSSNIPRSRHKGLHSRRLLSVPPLDDGAMSTPAASRLRPVSSNSVPYIQLAEEVARRLNEEFSPSWYSAIWNSIMGDTNDPIILNHNTAFVPEGGTHYGHLLLKGTLLGRVHLNGTRLMFTPRCKPSSALERQVSAVIHASLVTVPMESGNT